MSYKVTALHFSVMLRKNKKPSKSILLTLKVVIPLMIKDLSKQLNSVSPKISAEYLIF